MHVCMWGKSKKVLTYSAIHQETKEDILTPLLHKTE